MASNLPGATRNPLLGLQVICGAHLASLAIYLVVARVVLDRRPAFAPLPEVLPWILAGVAVMAILAAQPLGALLVRNAGAQPTPEARQVGYRQAVIVAFAVREVAGVVGPLLAFLTGDLTWALGLAAAAALAMLAGWPRRADFDRMADPTAPRPIG